MNKEGILIVVSGFSGSGKGTIMKELWKDMIIMHYPFLQQQEIPRPGEEDGREYFFKTTEEF